MISVTILTKNSERHLQEVLEALASFDEVLLYDTGSTDQTLSIAQRYANVTVCRGSFLGFGKTHNIASQKAKHDWILSIDSDEVVTPQMAQEIQKLSLKERETYSFPRHNYFNGKWIRWCGWYPDRQTRLYCRKQTCFSDALVHEKIISEGLQEKELQAPLKHYSYHSIADFLEKMQFYSSLFAQQNVGKKRGSLLKALSRAFFTFCKSYLLKRGFMGGSEGFIISLYNAHTAYYKYLKLQEANRSAIPAGKFPGEKG